MLTGNRSRIQYECNRQNGKRRVDNARITHERFFQEVCGDLLITGTGADSLTLVTDLLSQYADKRDLPTVVFSAHRRLFEALREQSRAGTMENVMLSWPGDRNYHPFYGMSQQQFLRFVSMTAEEMGCTGLDQLLLYTTAILSVVTASYPLSLPAVTRLLQHDDDFISQRALRMRLSEATADIIRANHQAGILLRIMCAKLEDLFAETYTKDSDTRYNLQSGAMGDLPLMAFYTAAADQRMLNRYLKEELYTTLKRVHKIRIVCDDITFTGEDDELLAALFDMKRRGEAELVLISTNVKENVFGRTLNFSNVVFYQHRDASVTEELSKDFWGTYAYAYPTAIAGKAPARFGLTLRTDLHWRAETDRQCLRVQASDLYERHGNIFRAEERVAVQLAGDSNVYLVPANVFLSPARNENDSLSMEFRNNSF